MLDNGSRDGSAEAARAHPAVDELIALDERRGKALNDSELLRRARGRYALLLNEDSELQPGRDGRAVQALAGTPRRRLRRGGAAAPDGRGAGLRMGLPDGRDGLRRRRCSCIASSRCRAGRLGSRGRLVPVGRPARPCGAAAAGRLHGPGLLRLLRRGRFRSAAARSGLVQRLRAGAVAIHHEQLSTDAIPERRIVELSRNRDLYMRKHHSPTAARAVRWLTAWTYALRALAALVLPGHSPRRYWRHVDRDAASGARRGAARGRRRVQPRDVLVALYPSASSCPSAATTRASSCVPATRASSASASSRVRPAR